MPNKPFLLIAVGLLLLTALAVFLHRPAAAPLRHSMSSALHGGR